MQTTTRPTPEERAEMALAVDAFRAKLTLACPAESLSPETHALVILASGDGLVAPLDRLPTLLQAKCGSRELALDFMAELEAQREAHPGSFAVVFILSRRIHLARAGTQVFQATGPVGRA